MRYRQQVRNRRKAWTFPHAIAVGGVVDAAQIDQFFETQVSVIAQHTHRIKIIGRADNHRHFT